MARKLFHVVISFPVDSWVENHQWDIDAIFNRKPDDTVVQNEMLTVSFHNLRARTVANRTAELVCLDICGLIFSVSRAD